MMSLVQECELMLLVYIVIAGLAGRQISETWIHGSIFDEWRAHVEAWNPGYLQTLILCPYCLAHWTSATSFMILWLPTNYWGYLPIGEFWSTFCWTFEIILRTLQILVCLAASVRVALFDYRDHKML